MADGSVIITPADDPVERRLILKEITAASAGASSKVAVLVVTDSSSTVTANLSATDNAVLDDISANQTDGTQVVNLGATDNAVLDDAVLQLKAISPISSVVFDTVLITYSDATKATISKVEWKLSGAVVKTLTPTFAALTDTWVRS